VGFTNATYFLFLGLCKDRGGVMDILELTKKIEWVETMIMSNEFSLETEIGLIKFRDKLRKQKDEKEKE
jgi:hypothetical protein